MGYKKSVWKAFALVTQLGISMLVPIFLCAFLGLFLEERFGIPAVIPLFFLGCLAGFRNVYLLVRQVYEEKEEDEKDFRD